jgi:hypothetical protein
MGVNQGIYSLHRGIVRQLTRSEVDRGYLFITKDRSFIKLYGNTLNVDVCGKNTILKLDLYGRVFLGKELLSKLSKNKKTRISFESQDKILRIS